MIQFHEDHYLYVPGAGFHLVEDEEHLVDVPVHRVHLTLQRVREGWTLLATVQTEENAQLGVVDLWTRTA